MDPPDPDNPKTAVSAMEPDDVSAVSKPHGASVDSLSMARVRL